MHLLIPFASDSDPGCAAALAGLRLPRMERLLAALQLVDRDVGKLDSLSPPHERALATLRGWPPTDGLLPWAANEALQRFGPATSGAWGWITPAHCSIGQSHVSLLPPGNLNLDEADARALLASMAPFFEEDGITLHYASPERWLAQSDRFATLPTASLDRVAGRDMGDWMPDSPLFRRLQNEMQMLLYTHPVNDRRTLAGQLPVNTFWLSGTGSVPPHTPPDVPPDVVVEDRLRAHALAGDWAAWSDAWRQIDAEHGERLLQALHQGRPDLTLTLCGARSALRWRPRARHWSTWFRRLRDLRSRTSLQQLFADL